MTSYLPQHEGLLPLWLLFVSSLSLFNTLQSFLTLTLTRRVYAGPASKTNLTPLSSRLFGTWTLLSCIIRLYAAYHIDNPEIYVVTFWSFGVAWGHFVSEWMVFGTMEFGTGIVPSLIVANVSLVWMGVQWGGYVG